MMLKKVCRLLIEIENRDRKVWCGIGNEKPHGAVTTGQNFYKMTAKKVG